MTRRKVYLKSLFILLLTSVFAFAQQNLFNVPSGDITNDGKFFYQHQFNLYPQKLESKAHLVYGLGSGWDVGMNLVGKGVYFSPEWRASYNSNTQFGSVYPNLLATAQKQFKLSEHIDLNFGTQVGFNLSTNLQNKHLNFYSYSLASYHISKGTKIVAGGYFGNSMFIGNGNTSGIMLGYEVKLNKKLYLMGDWISGNNNDSAAALGGMYSISKRVQLCAGWILPNKNVLKPQGVVLEINILGWDSW